MTVKAQIILLVIFLVVLGVIINMVKKRELELKYVLVWMIGDIVLIIFTCFPDTMAWLAGVMGIRSPMNMIFFMGLLIALCIIFSLTVALSRVTAKVRKLAQIISMLPEEIRKELPEEKE